MKIECFYKLFVIILFIQIGKLKAQEWIVYDSDNVGLPNKRITSIDFDSDGGVWISFSGSSGNGGLSYNDFAEWTHLNTNNSPMPSDNVKDIAIDEEDNIWLATDIGLVHFDWTGITLFNMNNSPIHNNQISALCFDNKGNLWISSFGSIAKYNNDSWVFYDYVFDDLDRDFSGNIISYENEIWVCIAGGILKYDGETWIKYDSNNATFQGTNIGTVADISNTGDVWVAYDLGFHRFSRQNESWEYFPVPSGEYYCNSSAIIIDDDGAVWYGANGGLAKRNDNEIVLYTESNSGISEDYLGALRIDSNDQLWIGTVHSGICLFDSYQTTDIEKCDNLEHKKVITLQNYPNPFNPSTNIKYNLTKVADVKLSIYNVRGQRIKDLVDGHQPLGIHSVSWDGTNHFGTRVPSGVYFCRIIITNNYEKLTLINKMVMLK